MTYRFFDAHGGNMIIDSEPGRGTAVRMWLPFAPVIEVPSSLGSEASVQ
jgi:signal transduction histidine kinase